MSSSQRVAIAPCYRHRIRNVPCAELDHQALGMTEEEEEEIRARGLDANGAEGLGLEGLTMVPGAFASVMVFSISSGPSLAPIRVRLTSDRWR